MIVSGNRYNENRIVTSKFDSSANLIWSTQTAEGYSLSSMFVNNNGKIFISGHGRGGDYYKFHMFVYNNSGTPFWTSVYDDPVDTGCIPLKILSDDYDNLYITGRSYGVGTRANFLTLKFSIITNNNTQHSNYSDDFILHNNYPNPFNPVTKISYTLPKSQFTTLKVFDALGKEIMTLVNKKQNAGNYSVDFDAEGLSSGFYFYKLEAGNFFETKRMVLLK